MNSEKSQNAAPGEFAKTMEELNILFKNILKNIMTSEVILKDMRGGRKAIRR